MKQLAIRLSPQAGKSLVIAVLKCTVFVASSLPPCAPVYQKLELAKEPLIKSIMNRVADKIMDDRKARDAGRSYSTIPRSAT
ncbi:MAG: hypothetical protein ABL865_08270, partial [Candidatus Nitrotoga sp.]